MRDSLARGRAGHETSTVTIMILPVPDSFGIILMEHFNIAMPLL